MIHNAQKTKLNDCNIYRPLFTRKLVAIRKNITNKCAKHQTQKTQKHGAEYAQGATN